MNYALYDQIRMRVLNGLVKVEDKTTFEQARHLAHDVTFEIMEGVCELVRGLDMNEDDRVLVLFQFGQRE